MNRQREVGGAVIAARASVSKVGSVRAMEVQMTTHPAISDHRIRAMLVNCGRIGQSHLTALRDHAERIEAVAACDTGYRDVDAYCRTHVYGQNTERISARDVVTQRYPRGLHQLPLFAGLGHAAGAFPQAERAAQEVLSLPVHPSLDVFAQELVIRELVS